MHQLVIISAIDGQLFTPESISNDYTVSGYITEPVYVHGRLHEVAHAAISTVDDGREDLNSLASLPRGITLTKAIGADNNGDILTDGTEANGVQHVYLLEPNG
jgi:hypothetical protein